MSAEKELFDAYREWERIVKAQRRAIAQRNWRFLAECQQVLQELQPLVTRLTGEAHREWEKSRVEAAPRKAELRGVIVGLIELASANQKLLDSARESALASKRQLEEAMSNVKRLQNSYVSVKPAGWVSFS